MDVNGTRFHLLQSPSDWQACVIDGETYPWTQLSLDAATGHVGLTPLLPIVPPPRVGGPLDPRQRRGAAADRFANWYWIGADEQSIHWLPVGTRQVLLLWPQPQRPASPPAGAFATVSAPLPETATLRGLAVTRHNYLVAGYGAAGPPPTAGLLVFDLASGARPSLLRMPPDAAFAPFDIAPSADGGCWVLDRSHRTYRGFDRDFRAIAQSPGAAPSPAAFQPVDGSPVDASSLPMPAAYALAALDPIAIEELADGSVLILDGTAATAPSGDATTASLLYRYRFGALLGAPVALAGLADLADSSLSGVKQQMVSVIAHDIAVSSGTLYAAERFGRQSLGFSLTLDPSLSLTLTPAYLPMHRFGGRALVACSGNSGAAVSYDVIGTADGKDTAVRWARLQAVDQPAHAAAATLETPVLDGVARDCLWDAVFLDACIPPGCDVSLAASVDNDPALAALGPFVPQPDLYLRQATASGAVSGAEIPYYDPFADSDPQPGVLGTWEVLLQQLRGRYLKLQLQISGNRRATPQLQALRVYYPRFSYARRYLPAVYQEDAVSASFVERLLANPKGFYTDIEGKIRNVGVLFDPRSAPKEALDWLAGWLGLALDPLWQDISERLQTTVTGATSACGAAPSAPDRRRLFIRFATRLYSRRGTADGIRFALHLLLEPCLEATLSRFQRAALVSDPVLNEELTRLGLPLPTPAMSERDIEDLLTQYLLSPLRPSKVRIVERFMTRGGRALVAGDPTQTGADDSVAATAHRFAVLVPETLPTDVTTMVTRIVNLEKPAHTDFEVRRYWDYFRVGEARLGIDTMLGEDSRFVPMLLGAYALSQGYLPYPPPMDAADRMVLDRDRVGAMPPL